MEGCKTLFYSSELLWAREKFAGPLLDSRHMKVVRLSAPGTGRLYLPGDIHSFLLEAESTPGS